VRTNAWQAVAQGKAGTIRRKHFTYLKKTEALEFSLPRPAELEAVAAPVRAQLQSIDFRSTGDADGDALSPAGPQSPRSPASPASPVLPAAVADGAPPPVETSEVATTAPVAAAVDGAAPVESAQPPAAAPAPEPVIASDTTPAATTSGDDAAAGAAPAVGPAQPAPSAPALVDVGAGLGSGDDDATAGSAGPPTANAAATSPSSTIITRTVLDDEHVDAYGFETDPTIEQDLGTYVAANALAPL